MDVMYAATILPLLLQLLLGSTLGDPQPSYEKRSDMQFNIKTRRNETGHRLAKVDFKSVAIDGNESSISVAHWTSECGSFETVALTVEAASPVRITDTVCVSQPTPTSVAESTVATVTAKSITPTASAMVPADYEFLPGFGYYKYNMTVASWEDARLYCESQGAMLITPGSKEKQKALMELKKRLESKFIFKYAQWIGLKRTDAVWKTLQGWSVNGSVILWVSGEPKDGKDCGLLGKYGIWSNTCQAEQPVLCEIPLL